MIYRLLALMCETKAPKTININKRRPQKTHMIVSAGGLGRCLCDVDILCPWDLGGLIQVPEEEQDWIPAAQRASLFDPRAAGGIQNQSERRIPADSH